MLQVINSLPLMHVVPIVMMGAGMVAGMVKGLKDRKK